MKPFPKWLGVVGTIGSVATSVVAAVQDPGIAPIIPPKVSVPVVGVCSLLVLLSHSLTGDGGKVK